jgi:glycerol-3-phosphate acyltransferase PlsY
MIGEYIGVIVASYLLGSIPSGLVLGKVRGVDVRQYGSGNIGTTNVLRTVGKKYAAVAMVADMLKGTIAVLIGGWVIGSPAGEMAAGFAAIAGHDWSVFIKFRGGRGVATSAGGAMPMQAISPIAGIAVFALVSALTRYVSVGSMVGALSAVAVMALFYAFDRVPVEYLIYISAAVALIVVQHRENISRLLSGTENRLGQKAKKLEVK